MNGPLLAPSFGFRPDDGAAPAMRLPKGVIVVVGNERDRTLARMTVVKRWPRNGATSDQVQFEDDHGVTRFMTDEQIGVLCRNGDFRILFDPDGEAVVPRRLIEMTEEEVARCRWRRAYVDAFFGDPHPGSRSRRVVARKIDETRGCVGGDAPCYQSVLDWADVWEERGGLFPLECLHFPASAGNRTSKLASALVARAVEVGTLHALATPKGTGKTARGFAAAWLRNELKERGRHDLLDIPELEFALLGEKPAGVTLPAALAEVTMPSVRTFQERMSGEHRYLADAARFGEGVAGRRHDRSYERPLPELPLSEVECDHTPCDVEVVDEEWQVNFGRPDLIGFRCRCTGALLGYSISFEAPSYAAFLSGLKHAMYPKDMSEFPGLRPWPMFGRPTRLYVDNGFHFTGKNIRETSAALGFEIREFLPGEPSLKGAKERLLGIINAKTHRLPGSTFSNVAQRRLHEDVRGLPTVTLSALRAFLTTWIVQEHHPEPHEGLGFMRNLRGIPEKRWRDLIGRVGTPLLPPEDVFVALAGDSKRAAVNRQGIRWDHIQYQSDELEAITSAPGHKRGRVREGWSGTEHEGTKYLVRRDPHDLGWIYVNNPHDGNRVIKVPAVRADYARGLTLHQHKVIVANAEVELAEAEDAVDALKRARRKVDEFAARLLEDRKLQGHGKRLARWLERGRRKHERSIVGNRTVSPAVSGEFLDPTSPVDIAPPAPGSRDAPAATPPSAPRGTEHDVFEDGSDGLPVRGDRGADAMKRRSKPRIASSEVEDDGTVDQVEAHRRLRYPRPPAGGDPAGAADDGPVVQDGPAAGAAPVDPAGTAEVAPDGATAPPPPPVTLRGGRGRFDLIAKLREARDGAPADGAPRADVAPASPVGTAAPAGARPRQVAGSAGGAGAASIFARLREQQDRAAGRTGGTKDRDDAERGPDGTDDGKG